MGRAELGKAWGLGVPTFTLESGKLKETRAGVDVMPGWELKEIR